MNCAGAPHDFEHFVLTRFSVQLPGVAAPRRDWLDNRFGLFFDLTVPSLLAQSCKLFRWLVFCDSGSAPRLTAEVEAHGLSGLAEVVPVSGVFSGKVARTAVSVRASGGRPVLTTRIDSDDAVARSFISLIHVAAAGKGERTPQAINLLNGLQLASPRLYRRSDPSNAFASLLEPCGGQAFRTVFECEHQLLFKRFPTVQVVGRPAWLQVIHGENLANRANGIAMKANRVSGDFPDLALPQRGAGAFALDYTRSVVRLAGRTLCRPHRLIWALRVLDTSARSWRSRSGHLANARHSHG